MRVRIYTVDVKVPRWFRSTVTPALVVIALGGIGVAFALPVTFVAGNDLRAQDLNDNFNNLDARLTTVAAASTPVGAIVAFGGPVPPAGWLLCDGAQVSRSTYANLYTSIGASWGVGDGATTFNLPDARGRFLRGVDGSAGNDPDKASRTACNPGGNTGALVGTLQGDEIKLHSHTVGVSNKTSQTAGPGGNLASGPFTDGPPKLNAAYDGPQGAETRPRNVAVNYIIKF